MFGGIKFKLKNVIVGTGVIIESPYFDLKRKYFEVRRIRAFNKYRSKMKSILSGEKKCTIDIIDRSNVNETYRTLNNVCCVGIGISGRNIPKELDGDIYMFMKNQEEICRKSLNVIEWQEQETERTVLCALNGGRKK